MYKSVYLQTKVEDVRKYCDSLSGPELTVAILVRDLAPRRPRTLLEIQDRSKRIPADHPCVEALIATDPSQDPLGQTIRSVIFPFHLRSFHHLHSLPLIATSRLGLVSCAPKCL
jgi:hypothetical protein